MHALLAEGATRRTAAKIVHGETGIPFSTLRRHLADKAPPNSAHASLEELAIYETEHAEEITRAELETRRVREEREAKEKTRQAEALYDRLSLPFASPANKKTPK